MKCRLLYVVGQLGPGGLERQLYLLLQTMDRDRYRPEVVVWNYHEDETYVEPLRALNIPVHFFLCQSGFAKLNAFRRLVTRLEPEVIHSYTFYTNFAARWAALGGKVIFAGLAAGGFFYGKKFCWGLLGLF